MRPGVQQLHHSIHGTFRWISHQLPELGFCPSHHIRKGDALRHELDIRAAEQLGQSLIDECCVVHHSIFPQP